MMDQPTDAIPKHFLHPCTIFVHGQEHWVTTLLGSCIAVCLWDPKLQLGGINHYMLPLWNGDGLPTPKFGNIAIEKLIERMQRLGSPKDRLIAKCFGGARVISGETGTYCVGDRNILVAQELLDRHGIQIAAWEVGGVRGMKILFNTRTGKVLVKRLSSGDTVAANLPDGRPKKTQPG